MQIPQQLQGSPALTYCIQKGWTWREKNEGVELEVCPLCHKDNWHFYIICNNSNQDGLYKCLKCGKGGNLSTLREAMGDKVPGALGGNEWASNKKTEDLPDVEACHQALLADADAMDYLMNVRGFSREIILKQRLGLVNERYFRELGQKVRALVYPYLTQGNCVFAHYRSLPPSPKAFSSPIGHDVPLYNADALQEGIKELVLVEGEANVIAAMDKGIHNIVGVPGANVSKALWISVIDQILPDPENDRIYILYDKDKNQAGQNGAQSLASRIGINRCYKMVLPDFMVPDDKNPGQERLGKDLNEWFVYGGGTPEKFEDVKKNAQQFDVYGVVHTLHGVDELIAYLEGKEDLAPTYLSEWKPLNKFIGFENGDVIDICAPEKIGKSTFGMALLEHMVKSYGENGIVICGEMSIQKLMRKWVCNVTGFEEKQGLEPHTPEAVAFKDGMIAAAKQAKEAATGRKGSLFFCNPVFSQGLDDVFKLIHDVIRRYDVKWVMIDNLQLLCDQTLKDYKHRTIHLSSISKTLAGIAKQYASAGVKMVRILQPHRIGEGKIISSDNIDGSSQIAKDCDCLITLWRARVGEMTANQFKQTGYMEASNSFDSKMLVNVALSRYSTGGEVTLEFDGARGQIRELNTAPKVLSVQAEEPTAVEQEPAETI